MYDIFSIEKKKNMLQLTTEFGDIKYAIRDCLYLIILFGLASLISRPPS